MNFSKISFLIIFLLTIYSCKPDGSSKTNDSDSTATELELTGIYELPKELPYSNHDPENFNCDKFYPLGWSKDGLFAYIEEVADEGSGYYFFKIIIQNMISDKIEWELEPTYSEDGDLASIWTENYTLIQSKLKGKKIIQNKNFELGETNFKYLNKEYTLKIETKTEKNEDFGFDVITETQVKLTSPQLGTKTIYDYKETKYSMVLGQIVSGYIQSPFEDRIAVIIKSERWGYEGPPSTIHFTVTGCNLTESFQPETKK